MAKFSTYAPFLKSWEGGYISHPLDKGGPTNMGVTYATYSLYLRKRGRTPSAEALKTMTDAEWTAIMKGNYWDCVCGDGIHTQGVANLIADWAVHSGVSTATRAAQRIVGARPDGIFGQKTLDAVNGFDQTLLFLRLRQARLDFLAGIVKNKPSQKAFLAGWERRVKSMRYSSLTLNDKKKTEIKW